MKAKLLSIFALMFFVSMNSWAQFYAPPGGGGTKSLTLSKTELSMTGGDVATLSCTYSGIGLVNPSWKITSGAGCIYFSENEEVAGAIGNSVTVYAIAGGTATIECSAGDLTATCSVTVVNPTTTLNETADNATFLAAKNGRVYDITLTRTLQTGGWNTFCAPFSTATPSGWTVKELSSSAFDSSTGELTLNFGNAASIEAGKPYLVKVTATVENPTFNGVTVSNTTTTTETTAVDFVPTLGKTLVTGPTGDESNTKAVLFLATGNKLVNPTVVNDTENASSYIKGFRAYFQVKGQAAEARSFALNMGGDATGIVDNKREPITNNRYYDLQGRKVSGNAAKKGVYVVNGKKVIK